MNRKLKFRYFWEEKWHYIDFHNDNTGLAFAEYENRKTSRLYQFTGLADKNGKEIYEGDIIRTMDEIAKVFFNVSTACFDIEYNGGDCDQLVTTFGEWYADQNEIIGNIYQTPELLTK